MTTPLKGRLLGSPRQRVIALSILLVGIGAAALTLATAHFGAPRAPFHVPWWGFVPAFMATQAMMFHLEIRDEAHSFSVSELPLVIGFFFAAPWAVVVGRLLGEALYLVFIRRQAMLKLAFNLAVFAAETGVAVLVFRALGDGAGPLLPRSWPAVLAGVVTADVLSLVAVTAAIRWHGGPARLGSGCHHRSRHSGDSRSGALDRRLARIH